MSGTQQNWAGNLTYSRGSFHEPATLDELCAVVAGADRVKALGSRHSFSTVADTTGVHVSTRGLGLAVEVDGSTRVAVVPGGLTFTEVARQLDGQGWALHNLGSLPHISVAGACATGTHGSGDALGSLATAAVAVELVLADGSVTRIDETDSRFAGAVLSLGALGVVTRLWLRVQPTYDVRQQVWTGLPLADVAEQALAVHASGTSVSVFSDFTDADRVTSVWVKQRTDAPQDLAPVLAGHDPVTSPVHPVPGQDPVACTPHLGDVGPWHTRLPHFSADFVPSVGEELQTEYFLPREAAPHLVPALQSVADALTPALMVFEMRTVAADDLWLSPVRGRDSVLAHFTWRLDPEAAGRALDVVERVLAPWSPRPHWGKVVAGESTRARPTDHLELDAFRALRDDLDPTGAFDNAFLRTHLGVRS